MENQDLQIEQQLPSASRRRWSDAEKEQILKEADATSVSATARKHGLTTSLLFQWRKQANGDEHDGSNCDPLAQFSQQLKKIQELEKQVQPKIINQLIADLRGGKLNAYNAANAFASLTNGIARLLSMELDLIDRLAALQVNLKPGRPTEYSFENPEPEVSKEARAWLYALVKEQVERKKAERGS